MTHQRALILRGGISVAITGLIVLLALPTVGTATAALQTTEEPGRTLTPADAANVDAQFGTRGAASQGPAAVFDPFGAPGTVLVRGVNAQPSGQFQLMTYALEEVTLPSGVPVPVLGGRPADATVLRLTVLGGPFSVGAIPLIVWLDDVPLPTASIGADLRTVSALVTDRATLKNGAVISVSYGESADLRQRLVETLSLPGGAR